MATIAPAEVASRSLQTFVLDDLAQFTAEGEFGPNASPDYRVLYVGRDDVHDALMYVFGLIKVSLKMNMFGFDDEDLNAAIMGLVKDERVLVQVSLDKSQASGVHEKKILSGDLSTLLPDDVAKDPRSFGSHFAIGESSTHQILHTKGGVLDNVVAFEGSTNWSASGEGTGIGLRGRQSIKGFKAQANTVTFHTNPYEIAKYTATLDNWYAIAASQPQPAWVNGQAGAPAAPAAK